ncbi:hypothetical protein PV379_48910 [Streptomyces caniscabiei]|uniref:hypothetical protein n=1 Tax=Streptomyces caniscabiei TaxID=2746961 RepID=UPI0029B2B6A4|nr:hypothetical protein [Streptomyces caniscabiei]MDX2601958.1 hypothetical protein [Streptomyces caniscabiei]MDX2737393.1 hypothetical protein [Streptomyces caniscabiei]MDX2785157.1 hypothetical protein [Streptomyces caniscabiei]
MLILILSVVLLLALGGVVCVYWTARGDAPRWARGVARTTDVASGILLSANKSNRSGSQNSVDND